MGFELFHIEIFKILKLLNKSNFVKVFFYFSGGSLELEREVTHWFVLSSPILSHSPTLPKSYNFILSPHHSFLFRLSFSTTVRVVHQFGEKLPILRLFNDCHCTVVYPMNHILHRSSKRYKDDPAPTAPVVPAFNRIFHMKERSGPWKAIRPGFNEALDSNTLLKRNFFA